MIEKYLDDLDSFISASPAIADIEIIRRDIRDTGFEKTALYRYRLHLKDSSLIEITERIVDDGKKLETTKYRYHWQDQNGKLIKRWDNAPHHPEVHTHPHHVHEGSEDNVKPHTASKTENVLNIISSIIAK